MLVSNPNNPGLKPQSGQNSSFFVACERGARERAYVFIAHIAVFPFASYVYVRVECKSLFLPGCLLVFFSAFFVFDVGPSSLNPRFNSLPLFLQKTRRRRKNQHQQTQYYYPWDKMGKKKKRRNKNNNDDAMLMDGKTAAGAGAGAAAAASVVFQKQVGHQQWSVPKATTTTSLDALITSHQQQQQQQERFNDESDNDYAEVRAQKKKNAPKASKTVLRGITKRKKKAQLKAEAHRDKLGSKLKKGTLKRDKRHDAKNLY